MTSATSNGVPSGYFRHFVALAAPFWRDARELVLTAILAMLTATMVAIAIWLNLWNAALFDALESKSMDRFLVQVGVFAIIVVVNTLTVTLHLHLKRRLQVGWRQWLTQRLIGEWMDHGRHYQIGLMPGDHSNPDGRIAEDIRIATETAIELGHSILYSLLLLLSFVGILWSLSGVVWLPIGDSGVDLPGHMVWLALAYSAIGGVLAFSLGRPLVKATDLRQTVEADFRFGLVQARESSEAIALLAAEAAERHRLTDLFAAIRSIWDQQTESLWRLMAFSSTFNTLWAMLPILVSTPRYLAGAISLGGLMQTAQAFQQVTAALSWPVDNFPKVAEWRASVERILALHNVAETARHDVEHGNAHTIHVERGNRPVLAFRELGIANPDGAALFTGITAEIAAGDRVLIAGDPKLTHTLFKVVAQVWPWGCGTVQLPDTTPTFFMPERPYLPAGSLRQALAYPEPISAFDDAAFTDALQRVGFGHLAPRLNDSEQWDRTLGAAELQRLGFARLLLRRPSWIYLQEATSALDDRAEADLISVLEQEFPAATVIAIGHGRALEKFHRRKLTLEPAGGDAIFVRVTHAGQPQRPRGARRIPRRIARWVGRAEAS
ncbi:ABC transporter ATP-binding protein/permease [Desertibaculum subflavum]|uniref:ABC transporter ATP-binding protein/permease n=1 Tax=Desertibaculum subflavum TaxID=2268458 RepID=UPI0013C4D577